MNEEVNKLLTELASYTNDCEKYIMEESAFDALKIDVIKRFNVLKKSLERVSQLSGKELDPITEQMMEDVVTVKITDAFRIVTYPNIHNEIKYGINANIMFEYVINKIKTMSMANDIIDVKSINEEAIAYTLKALTGISKYDKLTVKEFKTIYKNHVFGSIQKVQMLPRVRELVKLATKTPLILNYINNRLIHRHVMSMNEYASETNREFNNIIKIKPEYAPFMNSYINCIETAICNSLVMYRSMYDIMIELDIEYKHIFKTILSINNSKINNEAILDVQNLLKAKTGVLTESSENIEVCQYFNIVDKEAEIDRVQTHIMYYIKNIDEVIKNACDILGKISNGMEISEFGTSSNIYFSVEYEKFDKLCRSSLYFSKLNNINNYANVKTYIKDVKEFVNAEYATYTFYQDSLINHLVMMVNALKTFKDSLNNVYNEFNNYVKTDVKILYSICICLFNICNISIKHITVLSSNLHFTLNN